MSTEQHTTFPTPERTVDVAAGLVSGVLAGVFGSIVLVLTGETTVLTEAMPAMVGLAGPAPVAGWLLFVVGSVIAGVAYAALRDVVGDDVASIPRGAAGGAAAGVVLWVLVAVCLVPLALPALGYAAAPAFPYLDPVALAAFLGYGAIIGYGHAVLAGAAESSEIGKPWPVES